MAIKKSVETVAAEPLALTDESMSALEKVATTTVHAAEATAAGAMDTEKTFLKAMTHTEKTMTKTAEEFVSFGQGNLEAFTKAGQIWAAGVQELSKQFAATAQAHVDQTVATFKALTSVKSFKEAVDLQSTLARSTVEKAVAETGKLTDASLKLAEQAWAPVTARVTLAVEKFGRPA
jgi:phasin family protein